MKQLDKQVSGRRSGLGILTRVFRGIVFFLSVPVAIAGPVLIYLLRTRSETLPYPLSDAGFGNLFTFLLAVMGGAGLIVAFALATRLPNLVRFTPLTLLAIVFVLGMALLRLERVSGELVPDFRFRWQPRPDQMLSVEPVSATREVDLKTTTADDFPQFLGPDRNAVLSGDRDAGPLGGDWQSAPPRKIWRQPIGAGWSGFSAVNRFAVTMEQRGDEEWTTCYAIEDGALMWSHAVPGRHTTVMGGIGPRSTPTIDEGYVYSLGAGGSLHCLDGRDGSVVWKVDLLERYGVATGTDGVGVAWGRSQSPLIVDQMVIIPAGGPSDGPWVSLLALNKRDGTVIWEGGTRQVSYSSPAIGDLGGKRQIISVNQDYVSGHDLANGNVLWEYPWDGKSNSNANVSQPHALLGDRVFLSKGYGLGAALLTVMPGSADEWEVEEIWTKRGVMKTKFTNAAIVDDHVYGLSDGRLECIELRTGRRCWRYRPRRDELVIGHGQLLAVGDKLLIQAESGLVAMVEATPDRFVMLGSFAAIRGQTWNNLCLYGKQLLVRNGEEAACYQLP